MKLTSEDLKSLYQESTARPLAGRGDCLTAQTMMSAATGKLSDEELERVADHLVACSDCAWEYRFVLAHKPWADQAGQAFADAEPSASASRPALRQYFTSLFSSRRTPFAIAAVALLLLALGGGLILIRQERLNQQLAERGRALDSANRSLAETRAQLEEANRRLAQAPTANPNPPAEEIARLRQTIDELNSPQLDLPIIDLDTTRGGPAEKPLPIEIPRTAGSVALVLNFNDRQQHSVYEVEIIDQRGNKIWHGQGKSTGNNKLTMTLPRRFLSGGRYLIKLLGLRNDEKVAVADFAITVGFK